MSDFLLAVIAFLIVLGPLILIHELGHFIAARLVGVTVLEFGLGFPPRAARLFEQGGTEFTLNWLPIGGFVRPLGEDFVKPVGEKSTEQERAAFEKHQEELARLGKKQITTKSLMEANPYQRIFFMVAGALMNFLGAIVILIIASMLGKPVTQSTTVAVKDVLPNKPAATAGLQPGDVILQANGKTVHFWPDVSTAAGNSAEPLDLTVKRGDQTMDLKLQPDLSVFQGNAGGVLVQDIAPGSPAEAALKVNDHIIKADDYPITSTEALKKYVHDHAGQNVVLTVVRDDQQQKISIVPRQHPPTNEGALGITIVATAGIDKVFGLTLLEKDPVITVEYVSFPQAISDAVQTTLGTMSSIVSAPIQIIRGKLSPEAARPVSPVGIAQISGQVLSQSIEIKQSFPILNFAAIISIALGVTNLLPIPGLDGGRILFVLIEILRGKPMDPEREGMVHLIGLMLLLGVVAIFVVNDLLNPIVLPH